MKNSGKYLTDEQIEERVECFMYVRDESKTPIGMVVLTRNGDYGWSLFNDKLEPNGSMDKGLGILIACSRAIPYTEMSEELNLRTRVRELYRVASKLTCVWCAFIDLSGYADRKVMSCTS